MLPGTLLEQTAICRFVVPCMVAGLEPATSCSNAGTLPTELHLTTVEEDAVIETDPLLLGASRFPSGPNHLISASSKISIDTDSYSNSHELVTIG